VDEEAEDAAMQPVDRKAGEPDQLLGETTHFDQLTRNGIAEDEQQSQLRFAWARSHKFGAARSTTSLKA
jgi:hypothetical protein